MNTLELVQAEGSDHRENSSPPLELAPRRCAARGTGSVPIAARIVGRALKSAIDLSKGVYVVR
ncbi:hypothetical protein ACVIQY_000685 [Bradyrhizobium sp. USDA 3051]